MMNVLNRYLSREFIKLVLLCQLIFLSIFLVIDFLQKIDNVIEADVSKAVIYSYFLFKIPHILVQMIPVTTMIAVIIMFCLMKKNNEIMAIKACGINLLNPIRFIIILCFGISVFAFFLSEAVVPFTSSRSNEIWDIEVNKQDPTLFYGNNHVWYKSIDAIYWIKNFDGRKNTMEDLTLYYFDKNFNLIKRINASKGIWIDEKWKLESGTIMAALGNGDYSLSKFDSIFADIQERPETFIRRMKKPEDMSYNQLKEYAEKVRDEGYDNTAYLVDMNFKIAYPLISFVLAILGIPVALNLKKGGMPLAITAGIGLCFLYMFMMSLSRSLGLAGVLPPIFSAWTANLIFVLFGIYLMMHVER